MFKGTINHWQPSYNLKSKIYVTSPLLKSRKHNVSVTRQFSMYQKSVQYK